MADSLRCVSYHFTEAVSDGLGNNEGFCPNTSDRADFCDHPHGGSLRSVQLKNSVNKSTIRVKNPGEMYIFSMCTHKKIIKD